MAYTFQVKFVGRGSVLRFCNWPSMRTDGREEWRMHPYHNITAHMHGGLDTEGRKQVLMHFGLLHQEGEFPSEELRYFSPHVLLSSRRLEERKRSLQLLDPINHLTNEVFSL